MVRQLAGHWAAFRERHAVEQTVEVGVVRVLVLHHDRDVLQAGGELCREAVERLSDDVVEPHYRTVSASTAL